MKYLFEQWKANWNYRKTRLNQFTKVAFWNIDKQRCIYFLRRKKNWSIPWLNFPHGLETHQHHRGKEVINQSSYSITRITLKSVKQPILSKINLIEFSFCVRNGTKYINRTNQGMSVIFYSVNIVSASNIRKWRGENFLLQFVGSGCFMQIFSWRANDCKISFRKYCDEPWNNAIYLLYIH